MLQLIPLTNPLLLKAFHTAFTERYLSLTEVSKFNVTTAAEETTKGCQALAPRYIANILLGAVRIYGHQVDALYGAVRKELQSQSKPQPDAFQAPKPSKVAATSLVTTSLTRPSNTTLSESVMQLEPVSVEAPRLQAQEADISFEEWQDASIRTSVPQSRSSDRIPRSETFLNDLEMDQEHLIDVPDDPPMDPPQPDLPEASPHADPSAKENLFPKSKPSFLRIDPSTMLSAAVLRTASKDRSDILRYPTFQRPPWRGPTLEGVSPAIGEALKELTRAECFAGLWKKAEEPAEDDSALPVLPNDPIDDEPYQKDMGNASEDRMSTEESNEEAPGKVRPSIARSEADHNELSQRTHKMLIFLQEKLRSQKAVSFAALTASKPASMKASALYEILQLTQMGLITLKQKGEFGDIIVASGNLSMLG